MPLDANGRHTLPPVYKAITGTTVLAEQHNVPLEDISQVLSETIKRNGSTPWLADQSMSGYRLTNIGDPKAAGDAVNRRTLDGAVPTGAIMAFAGPAAPSGWVLCFGQAISRTTYSALFAVIGTTYGAGDGGTTFNLPDLRGRVVVGKDDMGGAAANRITTAGSGVDGKALGANGGSESHKLTIDQIPIHDHGGKSVAAGKHKHRLIIRGHQYSDQGGSRPTLGGANLDLQWATDTDEAPDHEHGIHAQGGDQAHLNLQPSIILNHIIRTGV